MPMFSHVEGGFRSEVQPRMSYLLVKHLCKVIVCSAMGNWHFLHRVLEVRDKHKKMCMEWREFKDLLDNKFILLVPFCGRIECEDAIKKDSAREESIEPGASAMGAKSLCIPLEQVLLALSANFCCTET